MVIGIKDIGIINNLKVMGFILLYKEIHLLASLKMEKDMVVVLILIIMVINIMEDGVMI